MVGVTVSLKQDKFINYVFGNNQKNLIRMYMNWTLKDLKKWMGV